MWKTFGKTPQQDTYSPDEVLRQLDFDPEFVERAKANLFLAGLEPREVFTVRVDGEEQHLNISHLYGTSISGSLHQIFLPIRYVPVLHKLPTALAEIGNDDPMTQNTILRNVVRDMGSGGNGQLQKFLDVFDTHPAIKFAETLGQIFSHVTGKPFEPLLGDDNVARSKAYQDTVMIEGNFYVQMHKYGLEGAFEFFARTFHYVQQIEDQQDPVKMITDESQANTLSETFLVTDMPTDFEYWRDLFGGASNDNRYGFKQEALVPDGTQEAKDTPQQKTLNHD